jgi:nucleobase:cation symporter-1, NCS1 family
MSTDVAQLPGEQPQSDRVWSIETNGINPIPESERHGTPAELFMIWFAANIGVLGITYGAFLVVFYGLGLWQSILAALVGTILSFVLVGFISLAGKLGSAPTLVLSRASFGVHGNAIPTVVSYISLVGWETVLVAIATFGAEGILVKIGVGGGTATRAIAFVIIAGLTIAIGLLGHATILKIQTWFTWAFAVLTIVYFALELGKVNWHTVTALPSGTFLSGWVAGTSVIMAGLGIGWVNAAADYSRYLPRAASSRGVVWWTVIGASVAPIFLIVFGVLIAASHPSIANAANPADLVIGLPTWFLVPYLLSAVGGLVAGALLDIYSSGLNLLTLGVPLPRYQSVAIDGTLMVLGNIYLLFISKNFVGTFIGYLLVLGVLLAAWAAIFLVEMWMYRRRAGYDEHELYDPRGRYGAWNWAGVGSFLLAALIGLGLITSQVTGLKWLGYLLGLFGGKTGAVGGSSIGLLIAFVLAGLLYAILSSVIPQRAGAGASAPRAMASG